VLLGIVYPFFLFAEEPMGDGWIPYHFNQTE